MLIFCQIQKPRYKRKSLSESIPRGILYLYQQMGRERDGRDDRIRTCDLCVPNAALYQTEPHLDTSILIDLYIISRDFRFVKGFLKKNWNSLILQIELPHRRHREILLTAGLSKIIDHSQPGENNTNSKSRKTLGNPGLTGSRQRTRSQPATPLR